MNRRAIPRFLALLAAYVIVAIPFRTMNLIPGFTDVRPVTALGPVYGVFFGPLGCFASACGNLLADMADDALRWTSIAGFAANFLGPLLVWFFWTRVSRKPFALRTPGDLMWHVLAVGSASMLETAIITPAVALVYPEVDTALFAWSVVGNTTAFPVLIGIPLSILLQEELGFRPATGRGDADVGPSYSFRPIGFFRGAAARKYDAPRQGAFASAGEGVVELLPGRNFETALRDLDGFERVWIVFVFDRNGDAWRPTSRPPVPPRGRDRVGLFATRAPYRPNPIGLTCARLVDVRGRRVTVAETDLLDGTPVLDLKPYIPAADAFPDARAGWVDAQAPDRRNVSESPLFREQASEILALGGPDLASTARLQLSLDPFDASRKRVARCDVPGRGTLALRMFRVDFRADAATPALVLERIRSAYSPAELASSDDPYGDKPLHRRFTERFPSRF